MKLGKQLGKEQIHKILVISLSNIGDIILTFPVVDILKEEFPQARLSIVIGPKGKTLFNQNPNIDKVYIYVKRQRVKTTIAWLIELRKEHFDLVIDLRNTAIPFLIGAHYRTPPFAPKANTMHMKVKHLNRLKTVIDFPSGSFKRYALYIPEEDKSYIDRMFKNIIGTQKYVVISPGAANHNKHWREEGFAQIADRLVEVFSAKIVFVGDQNDREIAERIKLKMKFESLNLCGRISLTQLAYLVQGCSLIITNDSAPMHMASYLDVPVVAIFGPSDPNKFGPWSSKSFVVKNKIDCPACQSPRGSHEHICMNTITTEDVWHAAQSTFREINVVRS